MKRHRHIWLLTGALGLIALLVWLAQAGVGFPEGAEAAPPAPSLRDEHVRAMMESLQLDPRVRMKSTQTVVDRVARYVHYPRLTTPEVWYAEGLRRFYGLDDPAGAERAFQNALQMRPDWSWPYNGLGIVWFTQGKREEAMDAFEKAGEINPEWGRPHNDLAILYRRAGDLDAAVRESERALAIDPENIIAQYNYGVMMDYLGRSKWVSGDTDDARDLFAEARDRYEGVIDAAPHLPWPHYNLACSYAREGDLENALPLLQKAIRLEEEFRLEARTDIDFNPIRDNPAFQNLIRPEPDEDAAAEGDA